MLKIYKVGDKYKAMKTTKFGYNKIFFLDKKRCGFYRAGHYQGLMCNSKRELFLFIGAYSRMPWYKKIKLFLQSLVIIPK